MSERTEELQDKIGELDDADDIMMSIMEVFSETEIVPDAGNYYTFVYNAKTPGETYDQHPLIACTSLERWGFKGLNFHWGNVRQYTWQEVIGNLHIVNSTEVESLRTIPFAKFRINR